MHITNKFLPVAQQRGHMLLHVVEEEGMWGKTFFCLVMDFGIFQLGIL